MDVESQRNERPLIRILHSEQSMPQSVFIDGKLLNYFVKLNIDYFFY